MYHVQLVQRFASFSFKTGLILTIVVPSVLVFRSPAVALAILRLVSTFYFGFFDLLLIDLKYYVHFNYINEMISNIVTNAILELKYAILFVPNISYCKVGALGNLVIGGLLYTGNVHQVASMLWRQLVRLSIQQKQRASER